MSKNSVRAKVEQLRAKGEEALNTGKYPKALKDFTYAVGLDPKLSILYEKRCKTYLKLEQYENALKDADNLLEFTKSSDAYALKAQCLFNLQRYNEAQFNVTAGLKNNSKHPYLLQINNELVQFSYQDSSKSLQAKERGQVHQKSFRFAEALEEYDEAIKRNPLDASLYFLSGECLLALSNFEKGIKMFAACLQRDPKHARAHFHIGECLLKEKQDVLALAEMRSSLALESNNDFQVILEKIVLAKNDEAKEVMTKAKEWYVADITVYIEQMSKAAQLFQQAANRSGEEKALGFMGAAYTAIKDFPRAIHYYAECLKIDRELKDLEGEAYQWNNIGTLYYTMEDYEESMKNFERAFEIQRRLQKVDEAILRNISMVAGLLGKWEKAIEVCELVLSKNPNDQNCLYSLGQSLTRTGNLKKAIEVYEKSLEIGKTIRVYNDLGVLFETLKKFEKAIEYFQSAVDLAKDSTNQHGMLIALNNMGSCYYKMKKFPLALEKFTETHELALKLEHKPVLQAVTSSLDQLKKEMK